MSAPLGLCFDVKQSGRRLQPTTPPVFFTPLPPPLRLSLLPLRVTLSAACHATPGARTRSPTHAHMACCQRRLCLGRSTFTTDSLLPLFPNTLTHSLVHARTFQCFRHLSRRLPQHLVQPGPAPLCLDWSLRVRDCGWLWRVVN